MDKPHTCVQPLFLGFVSAPDVKWSSSGQGEWGGFAFFAISSSLWLANCRQTLKNNACWSLFDEREIKKALDLSEDVSEIFNFKIYSRCLNNNLRHSLQTCIWSKDIKLTFLLQLFWKFESGHRTIPELNQRWWIFWCLVWLMRQRCVANAVKSFPQHFGGWLLFEQSHHQNQITARLVACAVGKRADSKERERVGRKNACDKQASNCFYS